MHRFIITSIRNAPNNMQFCTMMGSAPIQLYSSAITEPLDIVELNEEDFSSQIQAKNITGRKATVEEYNGLVSKMLSERPDYNGITTRIKELDSAFTKMEAKISEMASRIFQNFITGAPIIFRFHNDCDGASGAIAIFKALEKLEKENRIDTSNCLWIMNKGVAYTMQALSYDKLRLAQFSSISKPLLCIMDFGTVDESILPINQMSSYADVIWIDHHPVSEGFDSKLKANYVNPWLYGLGSDITAGSIACAVASKLANIKANDMVKASLLSDHSAYAINDSSAFQLAMVLDAITTENSSKGTNITPKSMVAIVENKNKFDSVFSDAEEQINEAISIGISHSKLHKYDGFNIVTLDYSQISKNKYKYVRHGRFTSVFGDAIEQRYKPSVTIVYNKSLYSIRVSKELTKRLDLLPMISEMKDNTDFIMNGGGHNEAASIKIEDEYAPNDFLKILIKEMESRIKS